MGRVIELLPYLAKTKCQECHKYAECHVRLTREDRICSSFNREQLGEVTRVVDPHGWDALKGGML